MYATWVQDHSPNKSCTNSRTFPDFVGLFPYFLGRNKNFVGDNSRNVLWNRTNNALFRVKRPVVSSQTSSDYQKTCAIPEKGSQNLYFQPLWDWHNSQQLFLNSNLGVKWEGWNCENIYAAINKSAMHVRLYGDHLIDEQLVSFGFGVSWYVENNRPTRCQQENKRWEEGGFSFNKLHCGTAPRGESHW